MKFKSSFVLALFSLLNSGCGGGQDAGTGEDTSTSGNVAAVLGGAVNNASITGTHSWWQEDAVPQSRWAGLFRELTLLSPAVAGGTCPTVVSGSSNCSAAGTSETLTYSSCTFQTGGATWNGSQLIMVSPGSVACGVFPAAGTYTGSYQRTFGASTTRAAGTGTVASLDTLGTVTAFNGTIYSGGTTVTFNSGNRTGITIGGINIASAGKFNHSITTIGSSPVNFNEMTFTASGTVIAYNNLAQVKGTSTVNVAFQPGCCLPVSGTISTTFSAVNGFAPAIAGYAGETETLTLNGCGTGTLVAVDGSTNTVSLTQCF